MGVGMEGGDLRGMSEGLRRFFGRGVLGASSASADVASTGDVVGAGALTEARCLRFLVDSNGALEGLDLVLLGLGDGADTLVLSEDMRDERLKDDMVVPR